MTRLRTYQDAIVALNSLQSNAQAIEKSRKERGSNVSKNIPWMERLLHIMEIKLEDLDTLNIIHVSGTKGKGSTCAFTESLLRNLGYSTGFFSSPHLVAVRERIRLNGKPISEAMFSSYFWPVFDRLSQHCPPEEMPPYFKFLTILSFYIFLREKVDVAVVEVGIGGAYDSTNVIRNPVVCGVSSLGFDHMTLLGQTLTEIAWHKAGIFKPACPAVTVPQPPEAMDVLTKQADKIGAPLFIAPPLDCYPTESGAPLKLGIDGEVQSLNASLALQLCRMWISRRGKQIGMGVPVDEPPALPAFGITSTLATALETCRWPGRFQRLRRSSVEFYLDGAHTKESVRHCADWYQKTRSKEPSVRRILLFNSTADRKPEDLLRPLVECSFDYALFCPNIIGKTVTATSDVANLTVNADQQLERCNVQEKIWRDLADSTGAEGGRDCSTLCFASVTNAFRWIDEMERQNGVEVEVLVTGSLHLVGAMLTLLDPTLEEAL
ncbi:Folylpolyglutamate synthase, mitochondrial [Hypsibius exemplaris]|uniref:Folylpolyglutamate synthase n=1 Tax=Hypsibius exemplaris TaxID=2072580 RepID=A0A1W0WQ55_HYPEX|nr:Folylpolyglutamate synthase, mitochondrial [Hypsibius exemplaris]